MVSFMNRLYSGICYNRKNTSCSFRYFTITTVRMKQNDNGEYYTDAISDKEEYLTYDRDIYGDPFYQIFGSFKIDLKQSGMLISEIEDLEYAIRLVEHLTGEKMEDEKSF